MTSRPRSAGSRSESVIGSASWVYGSGDYSLWILRAVLGEGIERLLLGEDSVELIGNLQAHGGQSFSQLFEIGEVELMGVWSVP
jgi:hypothetical protein